MVARLEMNRRQIAYLMCGVAVSAVAPVMPLHAQSGRAIVVYKDAACGCCGGWIRHKKQAGFTVPEVNVSDLGAIKTKFGIPDNLATCHSAEVDGYIVEGHVPAAVIERLLRERPKAKGLGVPGMPLGSPGMEHPAPEVYEVILFGESGQSVFARCRDINEI